MASAFKFYGDDCVASSNPSGARGVVINGKRILASTLQAAEKIAAAGRDGVSSSGVTRTDVEILRNAGIDIRSDNIGSRLWLDTVPTPSAYITPMPTQAIEKPRLTGPFGERLPGDPASQPAPPRLGRWI